MSWKSLLLVCLLMAPTATLPLQSAFAMSKLVHEALKKAAPKLVPKEGKLEDSANDGPSARQLERENTREFERMERISRTG